MGRVIKFRIWDENEKLMYYLLENRFSFGICEGMRAISWEDVFAEQHEGLNPLQFTGLTDRNGKEIYEGDILKVEHPTSDVMSGIFAVKVHPESMNYVVGVYNLGAGAYKFGEVIGNIYEHPHLLEGVK